MYICICICICMCMCICICICICICMYIYIYMSSSTALASANERTGARTCRQYTCTSASSQTVTGLRVLHTTLPAAFLPNDCVDSPLRAFWQGAMKLTQEQWDLLSSRRGSQKHAWKQKVPHLPPRTGRGPSSSSTSWPARNDGVSTKSCAAP